MAVAFGWAQATRSLGSLYYFVLGGPFATAAAAILGRGPGLTVKQVFFLVVGISVLAGLVNFGGFSVWFMFGTWAPAVGQAVGTAVALLVAYFAGVLIRRGANARRNEKMVETFS